MEYTVLSGAEAPGESQTPPEEPDDDYGAFDPIELTPADIRQAQEPGT